MAKAKDLFRQNFIEYASYVIKDRAIPDIEDGLKPVQRRILHTMIEMDDGRFNKVANVVGSTMHYHPHGDASIYTALVNLANCDLFIDKQGNYGNFMTGDGPAAADTSSVACCRSPRRSCTTLRSQSMSSPTTAEARSLWSSRQRSLWS